MLEPHLSKQELLVKSCNRLPELVSLGAPPSIVLNEVRLLVDFALGSLADLLAEQIRCRHDGG